MGQVNHGRIRYIDAMRGTTMLLVVFSHVMIFSLGLTGESIVNSFFVTFRMPMFFFISGYIAYKSNEEWNFLTYNKLMKKKAVVQLIPTIIFFSLYRFSKAQSPVDFFIHHGSCEYWFTVVLFLMFFIYYSVSFLFKESYIKDIVLVLCAITTFALIPFTYDIYAQNEISEFYNLSVYLQFFVFGVLCRKYNERFFSLLDYDYVKAIIIALFVLCFCFSQCASYGFISQLNNTIFVRYTGLLTVFMFFRGKSNFFTQSNHISNVMCFVGRRTLDIYLLHHFFIPKLLYLKPYLISENTIVIQLFLVLFLSILIMAVCLMISEIIRCSNFLAHYCFGVKRT